MAESIYTHEECVRCNNCFNYDECKEKGCLIWCASTHDCNYNNCELHIHERPCCIICGAFILLEKEND